MQNSADGATGVVISQLPYQTFYNFVWFTYKSYIEPYKMYIQYKY